MDGLLGELVGLRMRARLVGGSGSGGGGGSGGGEGSGGACVGARGSSSAGR